MKSNIISLIGFMGSGKSSIGKKLSEKVAFKYIDLDKYIEKRENKTINDLFAIHNEHGFRLLESNYLDEILKKPYTILSLGGGTPCFNNNMEKINKNSKSIYLFTSINTLFNRLKNNKKKRPLIRKLNESELLDFIKTKVEERSKFYSQAHFKIINENKKIDEICREIYEKIM